MRVHLRVRVRGGGVSGVGKGGLTIRGGSRDRLLSSCFPAALFVRAETDGRVRPRCSTFTSSSHKPRGRFGLTGTFNLSLSSSGSYRSFQLASVLCVIPPPPLLNPFELTGTRRRRRRRRKREKAPCRRKRGEYARLHRGLLHWFSPDCKVNLSDAFVRSSLDARRVEEERNPGEAEGRGGCSLTNKPRDHHHRPGSVLDSQGVSPWHPERKHVHEIQEG